MKRDKEAERSNIRFSIILIAILYLVSVFLPVLTAMPPEVSLNAGDICSETITATKEIEDTVATQLLREEAMQKVEPIYVLDDTVLKSVTDNIKNDFEAVKKVRLAAEEIYLKGEDPDGALGITVPADVDWKKYLSSAEKNKIKELCPAYFTEAELYIACSYSANSLNKARDGITGIVEDVMEDGVPSNSIESALNNIRLEALAASYDKDMLTVAYTIVQNNIKANLIYDSVATDDAKKSAADAVKPVMYQRGQNIVQQGEVITENHIAMIAAMGLSIGDNAFLSRFIQTLLICTVLFAAVFTIIYRIDSEMFENRKNMLCLVLLTIMTMVIAALVKNIDGRILPTYIAIILAMVLFKKQTVIVYSVFVSIVTAFCLAGSVEYIFAERIYISVLSGILGGWMMILLFNRREIRSSYVIAGCIGGAVGAAIALAYAMFSGTGFAGIVKYIIIMIGSGLISGIASIGILPLMENAFSLVTPSRLLELSNPSMPVLKQLMIEAPGTYHHSLIVANLAEAACTEIGANGLLARAAAYYHDIGKLKNPYMFTENQQGQNPHADMAPETSAAVIMDHVTSGVKYAEKRNLPTEIIDIIRQHHGTTTAGFFLQKARQEDENVSEELFMYKGPKPQTAEAAVVMLADVVEAAVRSTQPETDEAQSALIEKLIKHRRDEGQLDEAPLTFRDITKIQKVFEAELRNANHTRIKYPEAEGNKK